MKVSTPYKGFTLVEMILYVSLCSILLLTLSTFLSFLLGARIKSQTIAEVNQQGAQIMQLITYTIRNGKSVDTPLVGGSSSTLLITKGIPLLDPTVFSASGTVFFIKEGSNAPIALTNSRVGVSSLVFQNISSTSSTETIIRMSFVLDYLNQGGRSEYSYTKTFTGSATLRK